MKIIVTGVTGMVGEGVLLACLDDPRVEKVLAVARRSCGHEHAKLEELVVRDFKSLSEHEARLAAYDACFYCAGVSSVGMKEADYTEITYETPLRFAEALARANPEMVLVHVSGAGTDGTEQGRVMWARVKGRAENALARLPFKSVHNLRPGLMKPVPGQKHVKTAFRVALVFYPLLNLIFGGLRLDQVTRAMLRLAAGASDKKVLEVRDIRALADS